MPARKAKRTTRHVSRSTVEPLSYDTKMIIVLLLLLFIYPVGLGFMWAWMKTWPTWVKLIITIPLFLFLFSLAFILFVVGAVIRNAGYNRMYNPRMRMYYQQQMMPTSPSPLVSPTTY